jgi:histidinol-phosphate/aromatic aminotransferase/cobyric acid decarboxylase-like protein
MTLIRADLDAMAAAVTPATKLVFVCSPNNPTGTVVTRAELERFLAAVGPDVIVALDEAYYEYVDDPEAVDGRDLVEAYPNLVVLRTFSKAYRLAGLRVGYAFAAPEVATALRKVCSPFSVSVVAQAGAMAALDVRDELLASCADVRRERVRVRDALVAMGHTVPPTQANFVWLPMTPERTPDFVEQAGQPVGQRDDGQVRVAVAAGCGLGDGREDRGGRGQGHLVAGELDGPGDGPARHVGRQGVEVRADQRHGGHRSPGP